jgi:hypothetical protein
MKGLSQQKLTDFQHNLSLERLRSRGDVRDMEVQDPNI